MSSPKSKIPVPISRQKAIVTVTKLDENKNIYNRLYSATTCSRRTQEEENFKSRSVAKTYEKTLSFQKPQSVQLKEDLQKLRRKAAKDEFIIKRQNDEIAKLKELVSSRNTMKQKAQYIQLQAEIQKELLAKNKLQTRLSMLSSEKQKLNSQLIELLEVKTVPENFDSQQLNDLKAQIKKNKNDFQLKLQEYQQLLEQKDTFIQEQQKRKEQLTQQHQNQIHQIHQDYSARVKSLESKHQGTTKPRMTQNTINQLVEQVLREFEQEQHHHPPPTPSPYTNTIPTLKTGRQHTYVNQQWYSQKYMPLDAMSWPTTPNLKIL